MNQTADIEAAERAVLNTYGKGIDPESVEKMYRALKNIVGIEAWIGDRKMKEHFQKVGYEALEAAKL